MLAFPLFPICLRHCQMATLRRQPPLITASRCRFSSHHWPITPITPLIIFTSHFDAADAYELMSRCQPFYYADDMRKRMLITIDIDYLFISDEAFELLRRQRVYMLRLRRFIFATLMMLIIIFAAAA